MRMPNNKRHPLPNPSSGLTLRLRIPTKPGLLSRVRGAISKAGGAIGSIDLVSASDAWLTRDFVVRPVTEAAGLQIIRAVEAVPGVEVLNVSDRTFLTHLGGKIEVVSKVPIRTPLDLSNLYVPGVMRVCKTVAEKPDKVWGLTSKRNLVAVISDGSSVLGLGNLGTTGALPALEAQAQLFKVFGDVDAFPICLDTQDTAEIIETVVRIAPSFGGISLEGISSPRCFEVAEKLQALLDIPVYHDDQHGTSVVVAAALFNSLHLTKRRLKDAKVVLSGVGASGVGVTKLLLHLGVRRLIGCDTAGAIYKGRRENMNSIKEWFADHTNPGKAQGKLAQCLKGADVYIGLSGPGSVKPADLKKMAKNPVVFALATPEPEVFPDQIPFARVIATGRPDFPNQLSNVLAFPGFLRGCLDVRASGVNLEMLAAAARALAAVVEKKKLQPDYIIPSLFNTDLASNVAASVSEAAHRTRVARRSASSDYHDGHF